MTTPAASTQPITTRKYTTAHKVVTDKPTTKAPVKPTTRVETEKPTTAKPTATPTQSDDGGNQELTVPKTTEKPSTKKATAVKPTTEKGTSPGKEAVSTSTPHIISNLFKLLNIIKHCQIKFLFLNYVFNKESVSCIFGPISSQF